MSAHKTHLTNQNFTLLIKKKETSKQNALLHIIFGKDQIPTLGVNTNMLIIMWKNNN